MAGEFALGKAELDMWPWLRFIPGMKASFRSLEQVREEVYQFFQTKINLQRGNYDDSNPSCLLDNILHLQKEAETDLKKEHIDDQHVLNIAMNLIFAGKLY